MKAFITFLFLSCAQAWAFDHTHAKWDMVLKGNVTPINKGFGSQIDYGNLKKKGVDLTAYTQTLSAVAKSEFEGWSRNQRLAFLMNAYNAFTVVLILTKYPNLDSIKDLGGLFSSPWKKKFFKLFGKETYLDHIEHDLIRNSGKYNEPRIHFAVVCASVGCPALQTEAFVADKLDQQLEEGLKGFLSDRTRNRYDKKSGKLEISKIFSWYSGDFEKGHLGFHSVADVLSRYAEVLADEKSDQDLIRKKKIKIKYQSYDWKLNDKK